MVKIEHNIVEINPESFSNLDYLSKDDENLLEPVEVLNTFAPSDNFIELTYFSLNGEKLSTIENYTNYAVLTGDTINNKKGTKEISIDVIKDFKQYNAETSEVVALYNFLDYSYSKTNTSEDFYIESISPDRTELRLVSVNLDANKVLEYTNELIDKKNNSPYALELFLYEGNNTFYSLVNIDIEVFRNTYGVLVKLLEPLPQNIVLKSRLNVVEKVSEPVAYRVITNIIQEEEKVPTLRSANFDIDVEIQSTEPSQYYNYNELFSFPTNNTNRELNSLFSEKGAELSIDYSDYINFINFSSAEERILNFKYKLDLIESYQTSLDSINTTAGVYSSTGISGSRTYYESLINGVINNFDHYERHLYYDSGSSSWPKSNTVKPYINKISSDPESVTWFNNQQQVANLYDAQNPDILTNTTPAFIKEDSANEPYNLFVNMVGQHFDNIWIYTDALSKKYNADNRLNRGVSKDLVEELLKNFGVKIYTSNRSAADLYRYFTVNSYDLDGEILTEGIVSGSDNTPVSQDVYQKEVYKRLYHNLPLLMKSKGTERGLRALITCFGIPSDVLKIKVYGGQSVNDLPFYGGEQEFTSSLDKVRLGNTGSIVEGNTLSFYTSINKKSNDLTQDLHRIEVGFSPADNINSYIVSQSAVLFPSSNFNIDDYIGDPRDITTNTYADLDTYRDTILANLDRYDIKDFVRLIKFFDNNIFRMVRDFIPARVVADTGVIIKQHLLERNKTIPPVISWTQPEYTGSIDTAFISGSNGRAFDSTAVGNIDGQSSTKYTDYVVTPFTRRQPVTDHEHQEARFNGELSGSCLRITNGELNDENPFKKLRYDTIIYSASFFEFIPSSSCDLPSGPLAQEVYNASTTNLDSYPLPNLFGNPDGVYEYQVESVNINSPFTYDFTPGPPYTQYQEFTVDVAGPGFGPSCVSTRDVKVVYCNLDIATGDEVPLSLSPLYDDVDLSSWWINTNANNFPNHVSNQIEYEITNNGTTTVYTAAEVTNFSFTSSFVEGDVDFKIYDTNLENGTNCFIEFTIPFVNCVLYYPGRGNGAMSTEENEEDTINTDPTSYIEPFGFEGTDPTSTFEARLSWDTTNGGVPADDAEIQTAWVEITNTTAVASGVRSIPTGPLSTVVSSLLGGINSLDTIVVNNAPAPYSGITSLTAFNTTYKVVNALPPGEDAPIRMQIRATSNNEACLEVTGTKGFLLEESVPPLQGGLVNLFYSSTVGSSCCPTTEVDYYSSSPNIDFADLSDPAPAGIYLDELLTLPAPSGYYKSRIWIQTNQGNARYWDAATGWGGPGQVIDCVAGEGQFACQ